MKKIKIENYLEVLEKYNVSLPKYIDRLDTRIKTSGEILACIQLDYISSFNYTRVFVIKNIAKLALNFIYSNSDTNTANIRQIFLLKMKTALKKHHVFCKGFSTEENNAFLAVHTEIIEWLNAIKCELPERQIEEAYDVLITASRYLNHEYEDNNAS